MKPLPQMHSSAHTWSLVTQQLLVLEWALAGWCSPQAGTAFGIQRQPSCCAGPGGQALCPEAGLNSLDEPLTGISVYTICPPLGWVFLCPNDSLFYRVLLQHPLQRQVKGFLEGMELDNILCWRTLHPPEPVMNLKQSGKHSDLPVHLTATWLTQGVKSFGDAVWWGWVGRCVHVKFLPLTVGLVHCQPPCQHCWWCAK